MSTGIIRARLLPSPDGEPPMRHRLAPVTTVNDDGTITVTIDGVSLDIPALAGSSEIVGDAAQIAAWSGNLLSLGRARTAGEGGPGSHIIVPTSIEVDGGGSETYSFDGRTTTFEDVTSVSLNGINRGLGADITLLTVWIESANSDVLVTRLREAGTDLAGASSYHRTGFYSVIASGPTRSSSSGGTEFGFWCPTSGGTTRNITGTLLLTGAGVLGRESLHLFSAGCDTGTDFYTWLESGACDDTSAHDGVSILTTGTDVFSGTITAEAIA